MYSCKKKVLASTTFNESRYLKNNEEIKALIIQSIEKEVF